MFFPDPGSRAYKVPDPGCIFSLHASILSAHNPIFESLKARNVDFKPVPDLAFHSNADPDPQPWALQLLVITITIDDGMVCVYSVLVVLCSVGAFMMNGAVMCL